MKTPRVKTYDPIIQDSPCLVLALQNINDVRYLHYLVSFRVLKGSIELFGAIYTPSETYETIVAPSWMGSYVLRPGSVSSLVDNPMEVKYCSECHGLCGHPGNDLCQQIKRLSKLHYTVVSFRDVETAFGTCRARDMVGRCSAFNTIMRDQESQWNDIVSMIIYNILEGRESDIASTSNMLSQAMLIYGGKSVGKSSFCCFLINSLLSVFERVAFLDTDLGQPLLTAPGIVSIHVVSRPLIGSPHSLIESDSSNAFAKVNKLVSDFPRRSTNLLSVYSSGTTPEVHPRLYLTAVGQCHLKYQQLLSGAIQLSESAIYSYPDSVQDQSVYGSYCTPSKLLQNNMILNRILVGSESRIDILRSRLHTFNQNFKEKKIPVPLIINTHGWVSGLGWQLLESIGALTWASIGVHLSINTVPEVNESDTSYVQNGETTVERIMTTNKKNKSISFKHSDNNSLRSLEPIISELTISTPFIDIIKQFCGRLPISSKETQPMKITEIHSAISPIKKKQNGSTSLPGVTEKRWLRFMALFNSAYRHGVHFPTATEEEFFHGVCISSQIQNPQLGIKYRPQLLALRLNTIHGCRFNLSCLGTQSNLQSLGFSDIICAITGTTVALCKGEKNTSSLWIELKPWKMISYVWVHSINIINDEIYLYAPQSVSPKEIASANIIAVGQFLDFSPLPDTFKRSEMFPNAETVAAGSCASLIKQVPTLMENRKTPYRHFNRKRQNVIKAASTIKTVSKLFLKSRSINRHTVTYINNYGNHSFTGASNCIVPGNMPYNRESVFDYIKTGKKKGSRIVLPRACQQFT